MRPLQIDLNQINRRHMFALLFIVGVGANAIASSGEASVRSGAEIYQKYCAQCHEGGGLPARRTA